MQFTINTEVAIPEDHRPELVRNLGEKAGVTKVEVLVNSITVDMPIIDGNEDYIQIAIDLSELEGYYKKA